MRIRSHRENSVTLTGVGWLWVYGDNSVGLIHSESQQAEILIVAGRTLTITEPEETLFGGRLLISGTLVKNYPSPLRFSGKIESDGRIVGNTIMTGAIYRGQHRPGVLEFDGDLTLGAGASLEFELGVSHSSSPIAVRNGTLQVTDPAGVTIKIVDSGSFGAGDYVLLDWSDAAESSLTLDDFRLEETISGYTYEFTITDDRLILSAVRPPRRLRVERLLFEDGTFSLHVVGLVANKSYRLERTTELQQPNAWLYIDSSFPYEDGEWVFNDPTAGALDKAFYRVTLDSP